MKIGILTFHRAYNYGAVLQAYALNSVLNKKGTDTETIDYTPDQFLRYYKKIIKPSFSRKYLVSKVKAFLLFRTISRRCRVFDQFVDEFIKLSPKKYDITSDFANGEVIYDVYIAGSDQVWNYSLADFDPIFFLDFPDASSKKKYSYAASIGKEEIPEDLLDDYHRRLKQFEIVSVREKKDALIVRQLVNKQVILSCDPTLLLTADEWKELIKEEHQNDYILVYYVIKSKKLLKKAAELSQKTGLKVKCLSSNMAFDSLSGRLTNRYGFGIDNTASPIEFLQAILNASYVMTNSFHGTVFSILFHKQFLSSTVRDNGVEICRITNILETLGLEDRKLEKGIGQIFSTVNWEKVDQSIELIKEKSVEYLEQIIRENDN